MDFFSNVFDLYIYHILVLVSFKENTYISGFHCNVVDVFTLLGFCTV